MKHSARDVFALLGAGALAALALAACASSSTPQPEPEVTASATAEPPPVTTTEPTAAPTTEPTATAAPQPTGRQPSGRPPMTSEGKEKVSGTFGQTPAAKLTITSDSSVFRIPEYALGDGVLITFMVDKKPPKKAKGGSGNVWRLTAQRPPAEETSAVSANEGKFTVRLPIGKAAPANLALGEIGKDDKGKDTIVWKVVAPTKTEDGFATYELTDFGNTLLQITSDPPG